MKPLAFAVAVFLVVAAGWAQPTDTPEQPPRLSPEQPLRLSPEPVAQSRPDSTPDRISQELTCPPWGCGDPPPPLPCRPGTIAPPDWREPCWPPPKVNCEAELTFCILFARTPGQIRRCFEEYRQCKPPIWY